MKEQYCRAVARLLDLPAKQKRRVLEDLAEIFEADQEHKCTEEQTMERLGTPEDFARQINSQLGAGRNRRRLVLGACCAMVCIVLAGAAILFSGVMDRVFFPRNAIGGAVAMTSIQVMDASKLSVAGLLSIISLGAGVAAVILLVRFFVIRGNSK